MSGVRLVILNEAVTISRINVCDMPLCCQVLLCFTPPLANVAKREKPKSEICITCFSLLYTLIGKHGSSIQAHHSTHHNYDANKTVIIGYLRSPTNNWIRFQV
jgi:hypothetical protein